ncbi:MAG: hypothetical protein ALECFALPRED_007902 [Alectoria fallacina]|uniref:Ankyrin repeat protein n=1 Tax=Alectoria fallacina TaxID=1903189 RepID=A0A8H3EV36_9LECA|nr:MAG: hypothetical protein ALECFALPRED_007902 [Alectoria fallacina]
MDPITALGLLSSVSQLVQASNSLLELMRSFKDAEKEFLELFNDVSIFDEALKGFDRVLRSRQTRHNISAKVISSALEEAFGTIQDLQVRLVQMSKSEVSPMRRMKWVQHKSSLKKLHGHIREQSAMLQSFLALAHAFVVPSFRLTAERLMQVIRETFLAVCSQHPEFLQIGSTDGESDSVSLQESLISEPSTLPSGSSTSSLRRISIDTSASSIGSSTSSLQRLSIDTSPTSPLVQNFVDSVHVYPEADQAVNVEGPPTDAVTIRLACRYDCFCKCHAQTTPIPIRGFSKVKGLQHQCTEPSCQRTKSPGKQVVTSSTFFRKAISQVMSSKSIKVRYDLNTYRMVSEGSDAMRYVKHGNLEKLKTCIRTGEATLWDTAPDGWSLLHTAAYNRQLPIVKYLLGLGADTEVADVGTRKPADLAILKSLGADSTRVEQEIVEVFSQKDDYISDFEFTPIHIAVLDIYKPTDMERPTLERLIEFVDDANNAPAGTDWAKWKLRYRKRSPLFGEIIELFRASASEKPKAHKIIHNLLDQKDSKYCWTPLHWASSAGRTDKMKILMDHGADPFILSNLDANIIHAAAESKALNGLVGALEIWKLHPQRLDINQANRWAETPLHVAAWGSVECVRLLLETGADRNVRQEDQQVPLHCAGLSARGDIRRKIVSLLCGGESGAHLDAQDVDGRPPIFDFLDDPKCMEVLINAGARLDLLDTSGKSVFHHACIQEENESLKLLLRLSPPNSVMVTVKDHDGNTALIQAILHGSVESALSLLELDNVGDTVGQDGWAAIHHAAKLGNADVLEAVLKHSSFKKGMKTIDGTTVEVVAMEAGNWCGKVKELLRRYNAVV